MGKKLGDGILSTIKMIVGTILGYLGVLMNILGSVMGVLASILVVCMIVGICVYVKVLPMFTEAREAVFDKMVNMSETDFIMNEDTVIYDKNGDKVGSINTGRYKYVSISKISPYIYDGYIAVEDKRFKTHGGVDLLATMRAGVSLLRHNGEITQGGSTITQQVIKNNLLTQEKTFTRKIAEILLAPTVEAKFGKDKIMEYYCNSNFYGNNCYGVGAASKYYFGKKADELEPEEAALLIGLSNSPSAYDPVRHPEAARKKRDSVLETMYHEGVISKKQYARSLKVKIDPVQMQEKSNSESYVVSYAVHCAAISLMEQENFAFQYTFKDKADYESYQSKYGETYSKKCELIRDGGYKIYTSIDMNKQKKLQKAVDNGLAYNTEMNEDGTKYAMQGAAVCVDNQTNYVVAVVGGRGEQDAYNRAYLAARQSGSSIKPLIDYTPAFESGVYSPSSVINDHKIENGPSNAGGGYHGNIHLREAVQRSLNTVAWQVLETITPEYGLSFLDKMRFHNLSYVDNGNMALSLGGFTQGVRVVDMAKGFSTLANMGTYSDRTCIKKIEHVGEGTVYEDAETKSRVYSEDAAWMMTDVLKGVLNESWGTGRALKLDGGQIAAGKTGTTNSSKDVWFCGYTAYYTTVVWAGYDTPKAMPGIYGASVPGVIWKNYMNDIHRKKTPVDFADPSETLVLARYDGSGKIIEGTEKSPTGKRAAGMDYFSTQILEDTSNYASSLKDKAQQKKVEKKLKKFEAMTVDTLDQYYDFILAYREVSEMISAIEDDDIRKSYMTRCKDKYDSLKDETVDWADVVAAKEEAQKAANEETARETANKAKKEQERETKEARISLAKTKLKALTGYDYQPENMQSILDAALKAVNKCKKYTEYSSLYSQYMTYKANLEALPTKDEYDREHGSGDGAQTTPAPDDNAA